MVSMEIFALVLTGVGIMASIIYYANILNNANKTRELQLKAQELATETRQAQLFMQIYSTYHSEEFIKAIDGIMKWEYIDYDDYISKYGSDVNPEAYMMYRKGFGYLEGIGVLVRRGFIDVSLVDDLMSGAIVVFWEKLGPYIVERRKELNWPQIGEQIEYLYNQVKPIAERQRRELTTK
jgi:hypothetical protein